VIAGFSRRCASGLRVTLCALCGLILVGCANQVLQPSRTSPEDAWQQRRIGLSAIQTWELKGRLSVRTTRQGGQATLIWERIADSHKIQMYGPLGGGRVVLTKNELGAELRDSKKNVYRGDTAEDVLYRAAGWPVPFEALKYWVSGLPSPDSPSQPVLDQWGRLERLRQSGWEVRFLEYRQNGDSELPRKIFIKSLPGTVQLAGVYGEEIGQDVEVRLVISRWGLKL